MTTPEVRYGTAERDLADAPSFIEVQFPVSHLSKESYKERKAGSGQTLTGLGKWWGRKPLVLMRAVLLGLLLPSTNNPTKDREVFLALMTMDNGGLERRRKGSIPPAVVHRYCTASEREEYFTEGAKTPKWRQDIQAETRKHQQRVVFSRMSYDEKLGYCGRPEEIDGPSPEAWQLINAHLATDVTTLQDLVRELGRRRFGHQPRAADAFSGGGSLPFEAARLGFDSFGSDLSPVASLLTWSACNVIGAEEKTFERLLDSRDRLFEIVGGAVTDWGIEKNQDGWIAEAYLYCNEVVDPRTGWRVPLAGSWRIADKNRVVARLAPDPERKNFDISVVVGASEEEWKLSSDGTWSDGVLCPVDQDGTLLPVSSRIRVDFNELKGRSGLRAWDFSDVEPTATDVFQERIYCIRWLDPKTGERHYRAPTSDDRVREELVRSLLVERLDEYQAAGFIPSAAIEPGADNMRPRNARGWTHWHHLFNPRQLLINGTFAKVAAEYDEGTSVDAVKLLFVGRLADWNSRLCYWLTPKSGGLGGGNNTFASPAIATPFSNYVTRTIQSLQSVWPEIPNRPTSGRALVSLSDARSISYEADFWVTDPGYADMANYEELSEFFLAWYEKRLPRLFPDWYTDSKRALAVAGKGQAFRKAMVECYRRFLERMPDNGYQVVMFTHQNAEIWSDLALILWAAGLRVTQAWTVGTETKTGGVKQGNFVQGTVFLVLKKRLGEKRGDMADIYPDLRSEVESQMQSMLEIDPKDDPNFSDADYQLAAYAAALRVLTDYSAIDEIDVDRELYREREKGEQSPLTGVIERAVKIASDYLVPDGLDRMVWRKLSAEERLYMKGVEIESHGEYREGVYQEFARGFGVGEYHSMLGSSTANETRLKTPSEFKGKDLSGQGFAGSLLRQILYGVWVTASNEDHDPRPARTYLKQELLDYWDERPMVIELLRYLADKPRTASPSRAGAEDIDEEAPMAHWTKDADAARLLLGSIENDSL